MATFGPPQHDMSPREPSRPVNFTNARVLIQQRCFGTLAHELGNVTSPLSLIADVLDAGRATQMTSAAGTVRLVATAMARATTICRFLRGNADPGALSPATIPDTAAWWTLCAPFVEDMLPPGVTVHADVAAAALPMVQYEALTWATIALGRFIGETRPTVPTLKLLATPSEHDDAFIVRMTAGVPRANVVPSRARQLLLLASWEVRRVGGRVLVGDGSAAFEARITVPMPGGALDTALR